MKKSSIKFVAEPIATYPIPEFQISYKTKGNPVSERKKISCSRDLHELMSGIFNADSIEWVESFVVICVNRMNKPVGFYKVSQGGVAGTVVDPKIIFQCALLCNASGIILSCYQKVNMCPSQMKGCFKDPVSLFTVIKFSGKRAHAGTE